MSPPASSSSFLHTNTEWHRILHDFITQVVKVSLPTMLHITKGSCATLPLLKSCFRGFRIGIEVAGNDFVCSERTLSEPPPCNPRKLLPMFQVSTALKSHYRVTRRLNFQAQDFTAGSTFFSQQPPSDRQDRETWHLPWGTQWLSANPV